MRESQSDEEIVHGLRERDVLIYEYCIEKYKNYVGSIVVQKIGTSMEKEDVEEVVADVFFAIWKNADRLTVKEGSIKSYLAAIARNMAVSKFRKMKNREHISLEDEQLSMENHCHQGLVYERSPEDEIIQQENQEELSLVLKSIKHPDRDLFIRHHYEGMSIKELSKCYGLKESTVKIKLMRCRHKLGKILSESSTV